jgi:2-polyprenyl-3-methyl-5-hydroxy-6-metoxy-1,4-benzoquinol methylase
MNVSEFFDELYRREHRYWWRDKDRYTAEADSYSFSLLTQMTLRLIQDKRPGRALDFGAGEGADSIRLALMGYNVDAVEISSVGAEKIARFAAEAGVRVNVQVADISAYKPVGQFDIIICNGVLHFIDDKASVVERMQNATAIGGINIISLWSTYTAVPHRHTPVPVFCDDEDGVVVKLYQNWKKELLYFERSKPETSHFGMPPHSHSHIKLIARKNS